MLLGILLLIICFILPVHFFVLGEGVGYGLQGALYQYKITGFGSNLFTMTQDLNYILQGNYSGRTLMSTFFWITGSICIIISTIIWLIVNFSSRRLNRIAGLIIIMAGLLYLISCMFQYGVLFHGPAGISIPFGIPLVFMLGYLMMTCYPPDPIPRENARIVNTET